MCTSTSFSVSPRVLPHSREDDLAKDEKEIEKASLEIESLKSEIAKLSLEVGKKERLLGEARARLMQKKEARTLAELEQTSKASPVNRLRGQGDTFKSDLLQESPVRLRDEPRREKENLGELGKHRNLSVLEGEGRGEPSADRAARKKEGREDARRMIDRLTEVQQKISSLVRRK
jgi:hypothetical protein